MYYNQSYPPLGQTNARLQFSPDSRTLMIADTERDLLFYLYTDPNGEITKSQSIGKMTICLCRISLLEEPRNTPGGNCAGKSDGLFNRKPVKEVISPNYGLYWMQSKLEVIQSSSYWFCDLIECVMLWTLIRVVCKNIWYQWRQCTYVLPSFDMLHAMFYIFMTFLYIYTMFFCIYIIARGNFILILL